MGKKLGRPKKRKGTCPKIRVGFDFYDYVFDYRLKLREEMGELITGTKATDIIARRLRELDAKEKEKEEQESKT